MRNKYLLHSVLVHSGGVNGGHYYAYIRPDLRSQWFKFDDERVTKEEVTKALDEQYGEDEGAAPGVTGVRLPRFSNAYMLVYVRESDISQIICEATENDIAEHLRARLKKEKEEKDRKKKEKAEAHLYTQLSWPPDRTWQIRLARTFTLISLITTAARTFACRNRRRSRTSRSR